MRQMHCMKIPHNYCQFCKDVIIKVFMYTYMYIHVHAKWFMLNLTFWPIMCIIACVHAMYYMCSATTQA